ncbi:BESS domain-containing protein [Aphis craccivora]|uniref:BESS domain-containing protein n=1 Tax=Aphis craccivora TaxID=307492 RepID=A0A6G0YGB6_APHCR|nr:BESS domain-containing protein [Aphis craccivora]
MNGVMISEKGKLLVIKNRYKFCFHKYLKQGIERWKCANHSCRAYFKIEKLFENECHNHEQYSVSDLKRQELNNKLKRIVKKNMKSKPAEIIHIELSNHNMNTLTSGDIKLIKQNIYRTRSKLKTKV